MRPNGFNNALNLKTQRDLTTFFFFYKEITHCYVASSHFADHHEAYVITVNIFTEKFGLGTERIYSILAAIYVLSRLLRCGPP